MEAVFAATRPNHHLRFLLAHDGGGPMKRNAFKIKETLLKQTLSYSHFFIHLLYEYVRATCFPNAAYFPAIRGRPAPRFPVALFSFFPSLSFFR